MQHQYTHNPPNITASSRAASGGLTAQMQTSLGDARQLSRTVEANLKASALSDPDFLGSFQYRLARLRWAVFGGAGPVEPTTAKKADSDEAGARMAAKSLGVVVLSQMAKDGVVFPADWPTLKVGGADMTLQQWGERFKDKRAQQIPESYRGAHVVGRDIYDWVRTFNRGNAAQTEEVLQAASIYVYTHTTRHGRYFDAGTKYANALALFKNKVKLLNADEADKYKRDRDRHEPSSVETEEGATLDVFDRLEDPRALNSPSFWDQLERSYRTSPQRFQEVRKRLSGVLDGDALVYFDASMDHFPPPAKLFTVPSETSPMSRVRQYWADNGKDMPDVNFSQYRNRLNEAICNAFEAVDALDR